jgi:hypothetical protein
MSQYYRLTNTEKTPTQSDLELKTKRLGTILTEADLVSISQLDLALKDQANFPDLRIGEILAMRGWIKPETANFFVQNWSHILQDEDRQPLGQYLIQSGILKPEQLEAVLEEQKNTGIRFGTIAVMQGHLKSTTLDFFLMYLFPDEIAVSPFVNMYRTMPLEISTSDTEYTDLDPQFFEDWDDETLAKKDRDRPKDNF